MSFQATKDSKLQARAERLGATYPVSSFSKGGRGGTYNLYLVLAVVLVVGACVGKVNPWLSAFITASTIAGFLLDAESVQRKLDLAALPAQLVAYAELVLLWFRDVWLGLVLIFACYTLVEPYWKRVCLWDGNNFWPLYGTYIAFRLVLLARYLLSIWKRWDDALPPFEIQRANLGTRAKAARHLLWSFFVGNVGLLVRSGHQAAAIVLFDSVQTSLGIQDVHLGPFAAALGVVIWVFVLHSMVVSYGALYYKLHRTMHENKSLYVAIHRLHHKGVHPTALDSGTESPFEYFMTTAQLYGYWLLPDWCSYALELPAAYAACHSHHTRLSSDNRLHYHVDHHRLYKVNYTLEPASGDRLFGTVFTGTFREEQAVDGAAAAPAAQP
jgi:sterol desaturase/sphingolipid hydroxylase (fatty acid hydroxylase superfamily)